VSAQPSAIPFSLNRSDRFLPDAPDISPLQAKMASLDSTEPSAVETIQTVPPLPLLPPLHRHLLHPTTPLLPQHQNTIVSPQALHPPTLPSQPKSSKIAPSENGPTTPTESSASPGARTDSLSLALWITLVLPLHLPFLQTERMGLTLTTNFSPAFTGDL
jgi:hypothetical protein